MNKKFVKFVGNIDSLLRGLPRELTLQTYFKGENKFELIGQEEEVLEIFVEIDESLHFFYVSFEDVEHFFN